MFGHGCKICDKISGKHKRASLTLDEYKTVAAHYHSNKYDYSLVSLDDAIIKIICKKHGEFTTRQSAHISPGQLYGCSKCAKNFPKGEEKIINFLKLHNIGFEHQKTFPWAFANNDTTPLRYDFFIPHLNMTIEFDGPQHFYPRQFGGQSMESAIQQTKHIKFYDRMKNVNAYLTNTHMLRIGYKRFSDIETILRDVVINVNMTSNILIDNVQTFY
jgi:hypothetical protein